MKMTAQEYARRVKKVGPHSPLGTDCLWAFGVGGGICLLGEVLRQISYSEAADMADMTEEDFKKKYDEYIKENTHASEEQL